MRYTRLSVEDRTFLRLEYPEAPEHVAGLCVLEAAPLLDANGELDLRMIRQKFARRLTRLPVLRKRLYRPPFLCGPSLWVDDSAFAIERHIDAIKVRAPGDEASLLETAQVILRPTLDRSRPMWRLWFLTGLDDGRIGALFQVHHSVTDGLGAVSLVASLLDLEPHVADPLDEDWHPAPLPSGWELFTDNIASHATSIGAVVRHPVRLARSIMGGIASGRELMAEMHAAPRTSLNAPLTGIRHARVVHLDLDAVHATGHAHDAKINDVVLSLIASGLRRVLIARCESVDGLELVATVAATMRTARDAQHLGNVTGGYTVRLPIGQTDEVRRLTMVAAATRAAKANERPAADEAFLELVAALGLARRMSARQHMVNVMTTDVPGPSFPLYVLGARVLEVMALVTPNANVTLCFAALSYCGHLNIAVNADAQECRDIDVLASGMRTAWLALTGAMSSAA